MLDSQALSFVATLEQIILQTSCTLCSSWIADGLCNFSPWEMRAGCFYCSWDSCDGQKKELKEPLEAVLGGTGGQWVKSTPLSSCVVLEATPDKVPPTFLFLPWNVFFWRTRHMGVCLWNCLLFFGFFFNKVLLFLWLKLRFMPFQSLNSVWFSLSLSFVSFLSLILSLEAKLNLLHSYMNVTWIRIPSETRVT